jgi:HAD superfamily hydrolase (TIGR01450 family)
MLRSVEVGRGGGDALRGVRALLLDMDGVLVSRGRPIPGAGEAIARLHATGIPYRVITNTSLSSRATLADRLARGGIPIPADRIVTALTSTVDLLARTASGGAVYLLAARDAEAEFAGAPVRLLSDAQVDAGARADAVVVGDSEDRLTYENLNRAFRQLRAGAALVAMHRNPWWLTAAGPTLDSGALVVGLEYAAGRRATVAGKPSPAIFRTALAHLAAESTDRLRRRDVAMVGDDPATDLAPARRLGLRTVLVLTGKHGPQDPRDSSDLRDPRRARAGKTRAVPDLVADSIVQVVEALGGTARE